MRMNIIFVDYFGNSAHPGLSLVDKMAAPRRVFVVGVGMTKVKIQFSNTVHI